MILDSDQARVGIVTTGKSYSDVRRALKELNIGPDEAKKYGVRLYKVAMSWPLEQEGIKNFARGLQKIIVVEEKRGLIEDQIKTLLYRHTDAPVVVGKTDEHGRWLLPSTARLSTMQIAGAIGQQLLKTVKSEALEQTVQNVVSRLAREPDMSPIQRVPYFCAGCPHNTSTKVPEGSIALAGIGCHYMAQWMDRSTGRFTQMGAEGAGWIGESLFSKRNHVFQNVGDGTYLHSGLLAIRAAVSANTTMTFKLLYNDAVAMTGGQPFDGPLTVTQIANQLLAEGVRKVTVVTDDVDGCRARNRLADGVAVLDRHELDAVQREFREISGVTAIIYDQTCAAEKRRRRKRGEYPDPPKTRIQSIQRSVKAVATAAFSQTASPFSRTRPSLVASAGLISLPATRITPVSMASVRASSPFTAERSENHQVWIVPCPLTRQPCPSPNCRQSTGNTALL